MDDVHETKPDPFEEGPLTPQRIGTAVAIADIAVFAFIGHMTFEGPAIGALAGLFVGGGVYLFLPLFMLSGPNDGLENMAPAGEEHPFRSFHRLAAGFALAPGGIVLFTTQFAEMEPLLGVAAALATVAVLYVPLAWVFPNAKL